jgi:hypothetical protein
MNLVIEYENKQDTLTLEYRLRDNPVVAKWVDCVHAAQELYQIDDPARFYGFGNYDDQVADAIKRINHCSTIINLHHPIITRELTDVNDQDTLNYLHNKFEIYHGLLNRAEWQDELPIAVQKALSDLNLCVHRCESIARGAEPRHVVTYYGLPKDCILAQTDYKYFTDVWNPGTVFLNYCEIGKTIMDLSVDNDSYITAGAFQPFKHYSADFVVRFSGQTEAQANEKCATMYTYYLEHKEFFGEWQDCYTNGSVPLADLITPVDLAVLEQFQSVKSVSFTKENNA